MEQLLIGAIIVVVFFGLLRFVAKFIAWGLILFVGIPFLFSDLVVDADWSRLKDRAMIFMGSVMSFEIPDRDAGGNVRALLTYDPTRCTDGRPLRLEVSNESTRDVANIEYRLSSRPYNRSTVTPFREGSSDYIIRAGSSEVLCVPLPGSARRDDIYSAELTEINFMKRP